MDLDNLVTWCKTNDLSININKCYQITFSCSKYQISYTYMICKTILNKINHVKDLGIHFSNDLSFTKHITEIYCKAMRMLRFMSRYA